MRWLILGMKRILVFSCVLTLLSTSPTWAQKKPHVHRAKTDAGYWYIKQGNPQKISHYMREVGLTYLEWVQKHYEAQLYYSLGIHAGQINEDAKLASESADEILDQIESRMKINIQLPGDKDFLSVLKFTRTTGSLASMECNSKDKGEICEQLRTFISCKSWMQESIDSGIFEDSWHEGCYGDWAERHSDQP